MANDILIVPGSSKIEFSGSQANTIQLETQTSGSVMFSGASGSLFGISDSFSGSLMSVSDVSGIPILEVFDDDRVVMGSYSAPAMTITGSFVGVGTSTPTRLIHLAAESPAIMWEDTNVSGLKHQIIAGGNTGLEYSADMNNTTTGYHRWDIGGSVAMKLIEGGKLKIGDSSNPTGTLHVEAGSSASSRNAIFYGSGGGNYITMGYNSSLGQHRISWDSSKLYLSADHASSQGSSLIGFLVDGTQRVTIDNSGRVGIGTTSPDAPIDVSTAGGSGTAIILRNTSTIAMAINANADGSFRMFDYVGGGYNGSIASSGGKIGIGATSIDSESLLHLKGNEPNIFFEDDNDNQDWRLYASSVFMIKDVTNNREVMRLGNQEAVFNEGGADLDFRIEGDTNSNLFTVDAGNEQVGIGVSPSYKLHVAGVGHFTGAINAVGGAGTLNGNGSNLGGSYDLYIGSQTSNQGSRIILNSGHSTGEFVIQARQSSGYSNGNIGIYRRSAVTQFSTLMHIGGNGAIGIATESPTSTTRLTVAGLSNNIPGVRSTTGYQMDVSSALSWRDQSGNGWKSEKVFYVSFPHTAADRAVNLQFVHYFHGYLEITISGGYSNQNTVGMIKKRYYLGFNNNGNIWQGSQGHIVSSFGPIHNQIRMMNVSWDGSRYILPICHIVSTGNAYIISVKTHGAGYNDPEDLTLGSVYAYGSSPSAEYPIIKSGLADALSTDASGNVGIGTTTPVSNRKLRVWSDTDTYIEIATSNAGADTWLKWRNDGDNNSNTDFRMGRSNTGTFILGDGDGDTHMGITSTGNVGINDTTPSYKLDVNGTLRATSHIRTDGEFTLGGSAVAKQNGGVVELGNPDENSVTTKIHGFDGDGSLIVGEGETQIDGNLRLTKANNSWIGLKATDGGDTSGGGITIYETGTYSVTAPQYGAKLVYNENTDDFKIGTMSNNSYITQIILPRGSSILETRHVRPQLNNVYDIGGSGIRYDDIFATNGTINTSDRNEKTQISGSDLGLTFVNDLNPVKYQFKSGSRTHYGLIAQEVSESLVSSSIHTDDFAGYIRSEMYTSGSVTLDKKGILASNEMDLANFTKSGEENLGLRYTEFVAPLIKAVQELTDEVKFLRASITGSTDLDQLKATISGSNFG